MIVTTRHSRSLLLALVLVFAAACSREPASDAPAADQDPPAAQVEAPPAQPAAPPQPGAEAPAPAQASSLSPEAKTAVDEALGAYEQIRAQLAADKTDQVTANATRLEQAATRAAAAVPAPLQARVQAVATSAAQLKEAGGKSAEELRTVFGDVSRAVVAMISAEPALAQGRHVFECPMAQGYKKWVQSEETIANPYMGSKMLACGVKSSWSE